MKFVPENPSKTHKLAYHTVFEYESNGRCYAVGYRRRKQLFHYVYKNEADRSNSLATKLEYYKEDEKREENRLKKEAEDYAQFKKDLKAGAILSYSWGYDQTNWQFYQVVSVSGLKVVLREIKADRGPEDGFMTAIVTPKKDQFTSEEFSKRLNAKNGARIKMEFGSAQMWDGKPKRITWYA